MTGLLRLVDVRLTITILDIFPYWPKYSLERNVGINWSGLVSNGIMSSWCGSGANLLLREPGVHVDDVHNIALYNANVDELSSPQHVQILAFSFSLFLLLRQTLVATRSMSDFRGWRTKDTHSSLLMGLNWTASSVYSLLHAGHLPFRFSLI